MTGCCRKPLTCLFPPQAQQVQLPSDTSRHSQQHAAMCRQDKSSGSGAFRYQGWNPEQGLPCAGLEDAATTRCEGPAAASSPDRSWLNAQNALCLSPSQLQSLLQLRHVPALFTELICRCAHHMPSRGPASVTKSSALIRPATCWAWKVYCLRSNSLTVSSSWMTAAINQCVRLQDAGLSTC